MKSFSTARSRRFNRRSSGVIAVSADHDLLALELGDACRVVEYGGRVVGRSHETRTEDVAAGAAFIKGKAGAKRGCGKEKNENDG
ncbi:MAG: hypothetical protein MZV70_40510 [Desulfobacterales bacterium]|nr:hypothetical protein [Desulfobacterales bacterium]